MYQTDDLEDDEYFGDVDIIIKGKNKEETLYSTVMDCIGALQALVDMGVKDYESLVDFMTAYYKDAAPKVKEYFDLVRTRYKLIEEKGTYYQLYTGSFELE